MVAYLSTLYTSIFIFSAMLVGPFMPGISVDDYGRMVMDREKAQEAVVKVIPPKKAGNTERCNTVLSQIDEIDKVVDEYNTGFMRDGAEIVNLYMKYDSKPEDFQRVFTRMDTLRENGQRKIVTARFKMKEVMTAEEWKAIFNQNG